MNARLAKQLRRAAKVVSLPADTFYKEEGRPASWGSLPKKKNSLETDKVLLRKLLDKTPNPKFQKFGNTTYLRYAKGITREMGECWRSFYQEMKYEFKTA